MPRFWYIHTYINTIISRACMSITFLTDFACLLWRAQFKGFASTCGTCEFRSVWFNDLYNYVCCAEFNWQEIEDFPWSLVYWWYHLSYYLFLSKTSLLYTAEGGILQKNLVERCQATTSILSIAEESKFPTFFVQLEQVFSSTAKVHNFCSSSSDLKRFGFS